MGGKGGGKRALNNLYCKAVGGTPSSVGQHQEVEVMTWGREDLILLAQA